MPIYAYRCDACGHAKDVLQKVSDPLLATCPACGAEAFKKQLTAAGFQLKGSGWYATDFRNGNKPAPANGDAGKGDAGKGDPAKPPADAPAKPAASDGAAAAPAPSAAPASASGGGCGGSCACH